ITGGEGADTYVYHVGEGQDTIVGDGQDTLVINGGILGDLSGQTIATDYSEWNDDAALRLVMRQTEDGSSAFLEMYDHDGTVGTITFDLAQGEMIDTLKIGDLELNMGDLFEGASTVNNSYTANWGTTLQEAHDNTQYMGSERTSVLDKMEAALDEALDASQFTGGLNSTEAVEGVATETVDNLLGTDVIDDML
ncbi:MAG: hypothetical protein HON65_00625, partial [Rhodospirillales bacterium]|nr:hypothetical protein [Rhodospirillales bacterium]